jgi:predicted MPP superfamily phosphohydrolase
VALTGTGVALEKRAGPGRIRFNDMKVTRRRFLHTLIAAPLLATLYAWRIEPTWVEYVQRRLPIRNLPARLEGKLLVQLTDLHIGDQVDQDYLDGVFAAVTALKPEIVAHTGDFVTYAGPGTIERLRRSAAKLPRGRLGTVAVLGNHDYGAHWSQPAVADAVADVVTSTGCMMLRNRVVNVGGLRIGGVDDLWSGRLSLAEVFDGAEPPDLVLCHNPDGCDLPGWDCYRGWILAGHTHGGQCKPPFLPPPLLPVRNRRYTAGEFELPGGRRLYINRGVGHLLRVRFNVRPEVTLFRLTRAA